MPTIDDLITDINQGQLRLPEFQRGYVWTRDQAREFVVSLYRGHPTGHLLIWHAYGPVKTRGGSGEGKGTTLLLLDGQQRLTTLYALIKGTPPPFYDEEKLFFDLYFSVIREDFYYYQKTLMQDNPEWVGVHDFLQKGLNQFLDELPLMGDDQRTLYQKSLGKLNQLDKIHSYLYEVDDLKDEKLTLDEVVAIFNKVNSAGTRLSRADLAMAHICTFWPEARTELHSFLTKMRAHGFGIDPGFLVRATSAVAGGSVNYDQSFYALSGVRFQAAWPQVRASFEYLINVLRHDAYIDSLDDLTSPLVLVPILIHLARNGATFKNAAERDSFLRWMYLANIWGRYTGQTDTKLRRDVASLADAEPVVRLVEAIAADRGRIVLESKDLEGRGTTSGVYKFAFVLARSRGAKDWFTGQTLYQKAIGKSNGLHSHHIFPRAVLRNMGITERAVVNQVANRAFLTQKANLKIAAQEPIKYLPIVERDFPRALQQQSVPMEEELWSKANYLAFVERRRRLLARAMNSFLAKFGTEGEESGATVGVESLLESAEGQGLEFKSSLRWDYALERTNRDLEQAVIKTVAGLLNADGGNLLIGVGDHGEVLGLSQDYESSNSIGGRDGFERHLRGILRTAVGDATMTFIAVTFHGLERADICQVSVEGSDHPVYVEKDGAQVFLVRQGNATRAMDPRETLAYVTSHWSEH
jgi:hypothetical protein